MQKTLKRRRFSISLKITTYIVLTIALIISALLIVSLYLLDYRYTKVKEATDEYISWEKSASDLEEASDYLTEQVRCYVFIGDRKYIDNYFNEYKYVRRRDKALENLKVKLDGTDAFKTLNEALTKSYELMNDEYYAMRLIIEAKHIDILDLYEEVKDVVLTNEDYNLSADDKIKKAESIVLGEDYQEMKVSISSSVKSCISILDEMLTKNITTTTNSLKWIMLFQQVVVIILIVFLFVIFTLVYKQVVLPLNNGLIAIKNNELLLTHGVKEYKYFAETYNNMRKQELNNNERLIYEAEHDRLTGLYNRNGYYAIYQDLNLENCYFVLIDADNFKQINDKYGHAVGDIVLMKIAKALTNSFKTKRIFRVGGDEFVILFTPNEKENKLTIKEKYDEATSYLQNNEDDVPATTISAGVAFGASDDNTDSLYKKADDALYLAKEKGRNKIEFYKG